MIKTANLLQPYGVIFDIMSENPAVRQASRCAMRTYAGHIENKEQAKIILENVALLDREDIADMKRGADERHRELFLRTKEAILFMLDIADLTFNDLHSTLRRMSGFGGVDVQYMLTTLQHLSEHGLVFFDKEDECWRMSEGITTR
jgi:hypothetical protein